MLVAVLEWYRNKKFITGLATLFALLLGTAIGFASPGNYGRNTEKISYKASLGLDLDGDNIPETVAIKQRGSFYQVSIHFSTGRPKLRLKTYVGDDEAGLSVELADVNNDSRADLVITSATSVWPIVTWLNHGSGNFQRVNSRTYSLTGRHNGPRLHSRESAQPDPAGSISTRLAQGEIANSSNPVTDTHDFLSSPTYQFPVESWLAELASRGPPPHRTFDLS
jgi:hypothetical protein